MKRAKEPVRGVAPGFQSRERQVAFLTVRCRVGRQNDHARWPARIDDVVADCLTEGQTRFGQMIEISEIFDGPSNHALSRNTSAQTVCNERLLYLHLGTVCE